MAAVCHVFHLLRDRSGIRVNRAVNRNAQVVVRWELPNVFELYRVANGLAQQGVAEQGVLIAVKNGPLCRS